MEVAVESKNNEISFNSEAMLDELKRFVFGDNGDALLEEMFIVAQRDESFAEVLKETYDEAQLGDLNLFDLSSFKVSYKEALRQRLILQEVTFIIVLMLSMTALIYSQSGNISTDLTNIQRLVSSHLISQGITHLFIYFRKNHIDNVVESKAKYIRETMYRLNRTRYMQKFIPDYGEA